MMMISSNGSLVVNISSASVEERQGEAQDFVRWVTMSQCHNVTMSQCHQMGTKRPYYWNNSLSSQNFVTKATLIVFFCFFAFKLIFRKFEAKRCQNAKIDPIFWPLLEKLGEKSKIARTIFFLQQIASMDSFSFNLITQEKSWATDSSI